MENKAIKILSICLVVLFTLAVLFFAVGLILEYKKAPEVMNSTLNQFTSDVGVASEYYTPGTQQFSDVLRARIASNKTIAVVTIAQDNNVIFAYPLSSPFIVPGITGQPTVSASSSLVQVRSNEVELGNNRYIITSALYSLQPTVIYSYIRISFLLILAGTLIAGIALMYLYLTEQKQEPEAGFDDLATAERLKNSKIDFPEVAPEDSVDSVENDGFDFPVEDENQFFDENNLPEEAFDFPPPDEVSESAGIHSAAHFALPVEEELAHQEEFDENDQSPQLEPDSPMPPVEEELVQQEEFTPPPVPVDLTEIVDNDYVVEDLSSFDETIDAVVEQDLISDIELPQETELENAVVVQARFTQESLNMPVEASYTEDFDIDKALQGYEPPAKAISQEIVPEIEGEPVVAITETVDEPTAEILETEYFSNEPMDMISMEPIPQDPILEADLLVAAEGNFTTEPEVATKETVSTAGSEPAGLFSPITGFGWEAYLEERLDSELIRSASFEEDIGLMIIRIQGLNKADERNKAIYDILMEFYKFRDLIFEYGTDGFSCIVHSINVDGALDMAEQVYVALTKALKELGMNNEIGIGISTRSFRLIPGKRIFEEAEQALIRAFNDPETAIVAFRVDPEKYRQYISEYADEEE
ncbi:MAG: hypothetical protein J6V63_05575 [Spirochaetaceae bacterium]|nr:hypothetical protein [Spirochaetaceae bacterium]